MAWLVYGAYGYTGRLVAEAALRRGERPVLAGRDAGRLAAVARELGLEHRAFDLGDVGAVVAALGGVEVVAHCAGPFSATAAPMVDACVAAGVHYLDITGEIDVLEAVLHRGAEAEAAGVALLPGSGFDVVPSDCLAATVAGALPGADRLELAFRIGGGISPGTAKTAMESLGAMSRARVGGRLGEVPADRRQRTVPFPDGPATATAVSWGDVATAFWSTGVGDVVVYTVLPPAASLVAATAALLGPKALGGRTQELLKSAAGRLKGPSRRTRARSGAQLWAQATGPDGTTRSATMRTPNPYDLTADAVVTVVGRLLAGRVRPGAHTPAQAHGADFAAGLAGVSCSPVG